MWTSEVGGKSYSWLLWYFKKAPRELELQRAMFQFLERCPGWVWAAGLLPWAQPLLLAKGSPRHQETKCHGVRGNTFSTMNKEPRARNWSPPWHRFHLSGLRGHRGKPVHLMWVSNSGAWEGCTSQVALVITHKSRWAHATTSRNVGLMYVFHSVYPSCEHNTQRKFLTIGRWMLIKCYVGTKSHYYFYKTVCVWRPRNFKSSSCLQHHFLQNFSKCWKKKKKKKKEKSAFLEVAGYWCAAAVVMKQTVRRMKSGP